jgi:hypothetical protein
MVAPCGVRYVPLYQARQLNLQLKIMATPRSPRQQSGQFVTALNLADSHWLLARFLTNTADLRVAVPGRGK